MTVTVANQQYSFCSNAQSETIQGFMFKNPYDAWYYFDSTSTATQITDVDYPGYHTYAITSITSVTTTATVTTTAAHGLSVNDTVIIAGATQTEYNGTYTVKTVTDNTHFTYTFTGSATSPATGTKTATGGRVTVPGIVFLDGYFFVMDTTGTIRNSGLNDPTTWSGLDFIKAQIEPGNGVALAKSQNYLIAFKDWSTEYFYDAGNATGSPLSPVGTGFSIIGCASGDSVAQIEGNILWVSKTRQKGYGVHLMQGLNMVSISTPAIDRILTRATFGTTETVYAYGLKIGGHAFYVLTLVSLDVTLVYDLTSKVWSEWSSLTLGTPVSVTSITLSGTTATVSCTGHGLTDGDPALIAGANQTAYNGQKVITYVDANTYTFETTAGTTTPATGTITSTPYTTTYFKYTKVINALNKDLLQHETNGTLCEITMDSYQDLGLPVDVLIRTGKIDGGTVNLKMYACLEIIGNKVSGTAYVRHSGDDYVTNTKYRPVDLNATRSVVRRLGSDRRRSYDIRYLGDTSLQVSNIDVEVV